MMEIFWTMLASMDRKRIREYIAEQNLICCCSPDFNPTIFQFKQLIISLIYVFVPLALKPRDAAKFFAFFLGEFSLTAILRPRWIL